jgi:hypothetical protein
LRINNRVVRRAGGKKSEEGEVRGRRREEESLTGLREANKEP